MVLSINATMACKGKFAGVLSKAPSNYKSYVRKHFGYLTTETSQGVREVGKDKTVCRICHVIKKCNAGNTTNMIQHLLRHHPEQSQSDVSSKISKPIPVPAPKQQTLKQAFEIKEKMPFHSTRATAITEQISKFIVKDLRPYTVVEIPGFKELLHVLERIGS